MKNRRQRRSGRGGSGRGDEGWRTVATANSTVSTLNLTAAHGYLPTAPRLIAYNNADDYARFTRQTQEAADTRLHDLKGWADAARTTFNSLRSQLHPILAMVQVTGFANTYKQSDWPKRWTD